MKLRNRYFLLRHGKTIYQTKKRTKIYPWPDVPPIKITKQSEKEIRRVARSLKKEEIDYIYCSDIFRAKQTAEIVAQELGLKIKLDKRLRDLNIGIYQGGNKKDFFRDFPVSDPKKRFDGRPQNGESWKDLKKRIKEFIADTEKRHHKKNILLVSHGDPLEILMGIVRNMRDKEISREIVTRKLHISPGELQQLN